VISSVGSMKGIINLEEHPDKVVGRRTGYQDAFKAGMQLQKTAGDLQKAFGNRFVPKGVYRFRTHEEAHQWMIRMLARGPKS